MAIARSKWTSRDPNWTRDSTRKTRGFNHHTVTANVPRSRAKEREHMREIENMHLNRGFTGIGYHFVLFQSGRLYEGRPVWAIPAAQGGDNSGTVTIASVGNYETDSLNLRQKARLILAWRNIKRNHPVRGIGGHRDANAEATACPGSNLWNWLPTLARRTGLSLIRKRAARGPVEADCCASEGP